MRVRDLAWAAGIIDGEGCITLYKARSGAYVMKVNVTNCSYVMLHTMQAIFDCGYIIERKRLSLRHKRQWIWEASTKNAERVLKAIEPYLVAKEEECRLALLSRTLINAHGHNTPNRNVKKLDTLLTQLQKIKHVSSVPY